MSEARSPFRSENMRRIVAEVAREHGLVPGVLHTPTRRVEVVRPRQAAMRRLRQAGYTHRQIVEHFGLKAHTTSVHACKPDRVQP